MSAGGRAKLEEIAQNSEKPAEVRLNAAAELAVAQERIAEQRKMAKILNNPELSAEEKEAYLALEEEYQDKKIRELYKTQKQLAAEIQETKEKLETLNPETQPRTYAVTQKKYNDLVTRNTIVDKEIKQRENLKKEIDRYREQQRKKIEKRLNAITGGVMKVIDFIILPNQKTNRLVDPFAPIPRGTGGMGRTGTSTNRQRGTSNSGSSSSRKH